MAKRYILKPRQTDPYAIVDGRKIACTIVVDNGQQPMVEVWPLDDTICATKAQAQAKADELNGV